MENARRRLGSPSRRRKKTVVLYMEEHFSTVSKTIFYGSRFAGGAFPVCRFPVSEKPDCERTALDRRSAIAPRIIWVDRAPPPKKAQASKRERFDRAHTSPHAAASTWKRAPCCVTPSAPLARAYHGARTRTERNARAPAIRSRKAARSLLRVTPSQVVECQDERPRHRELVRRARHEEEEEEQGACRSRI